MKPPLGFTLGLTVVQQILMMKHLVSLLVLAIATSGNPVWATSSGVDDLPDLTGGVVPVVQYKQLDPFSGNDILTSVSEVEYTVKVKNQTGDPLISDSLVLVVDSVREISGKEISNRVRIEGSDGMTEDGKPFFRIPSTGPELSPYAESEAVTIRVMNPDFLRFYPPGVRVRGIRRSSEKAVKDLLDTLVEKGLLSPEDAMRALESPSPGSP
ncbi:MAG: hypothetical protein MRJ67_15080 [Nitrospirales bacterium]|nr:hypothetical protein [Nitrospira sp.]MDR4461818.1 hypothetical protein [Nitrospirales bacterium]